MADMTETRNTDTLHLYLTAAPLMRAVLNDVLDERHEQLQKWGKQRYENYGAWLAILGEEFGEVSEAVGPLMGLRTNKPTDADDIYTELIQVAAVAVAWAEQIAEEGGLRYGNTRDKVANYRRDGTKRTADNQQK